jgi:hypothetical protein
MQELFDRATLLLDQKVLKGLTIKMSGRLSGRKQGMAKQCLKRLVCYLLWIETNR